MRPVVFADIMSPLPALGVAVRLRAGTGGGRIRSVVTRTGVDALHDRRTARVPRAGGDSKPSPGRARGCRAGRRRRARLLRSTLDVGGLPWSKDGASRTSPRCGRLPPASRNPLFSMGCLLKRLSAAMADYLIAQGREPARMPCRCSTPGRGSFHSSRLGTVDSPAPPSPCSRPSVKGPTSRGSSSCRTHLILMDAYASTARRKSIERGLAHRHRRRRSVGGRATRLSRETYRPRGPARRGEPQRERTCTRPASARGHRCAGPYRQPGPWPPARRRRSPASTALRRSGTRRRRPTRPHDVSGRASAYAPISG